LASTAIRAANRTRDLSAADRGRTCGRDRPALTSECRAGPAGVRGLPPPAAPWGVRGYRGEGAGEGRRGCQSVDAKGRPTTAPRAGVPGMTFRGPAVPQISCGAEASKRPCRAPTGSAREEERFESQAVEANWKVVVDDDDDEDEDEERDGGRPESSHPHTFIPRSCGARGPSGASRTRQTRRRSG
jgi:hypothetical protein